MIGSDVVVIVKRTESSRDELGSAIMTETTVTVPGCAVRVKATSETAGETTITTADAKVYMPVTADTTALTSRDAIRFNGKTFEVQGPAITSTDLDGRPDHVWVNVRLVTG